ncbi:MAG TPA: flavin reductase family protein [Planctomycetota bacterium]|nr:flavin reductase family protein [Planctomycetota bacterium]
MPKPAKTEVQASQCSRLLTTAPCMVITTVDASGRVNAAAFGSYVVISPYVLCAVWPGHETYANIKATGEFVINVPGRDQLDSIMIVSRDYPEGTNELPRARLTELPGVKVKPPRIAEYKAHVECRYVDERKVGDHCLVVGEMIAGSCDEGLFGKDGRFDVVRAGVVHICRYPEPVYIAADRDDYVRGEATMDLP